MEITNNLEVTITVCDNYRDHCSTSCQFYEEIDVGYNIESYCNLFPTEVFGRRCYKCLEKFGV